jgi:hypothetical protein
MVIKICEFCGKEINAKSVSRRFCNSLCQRKHYYRRPERNKKVKEYTRRYQQRPEFKLKNKLRLKKYRQRPEVKERNRILAVTKYRTKRRKFWKEYGKRPEVRMRIREKERLRLKIDKKYAIADRLRRSLNHAMTKYSKTGKIMSSKKYGLNWNEVIKSLEPFPENLKDFEIDHIIPLHSFNLESLEEVKKAFSPSNLQWLTKEENRRKGGKL